MELARCVRFVHEPHPVRRISDQWGQYQREQKCKATDVEKNQHNDDLVEARIHKEVWHSVTRNSRRHRKSTAPGLAQNLGQTHPAGPIGVPEAHWAVAETAFTGKGGLDHNFGKYCRPFIRVGYMVYGSYLLGTRLFRTLALSLLS